MEAMNGIGAGPGSARAPRAAEARRLEPRHDPLSLAERRLGWLDRRQAVLAQNVANADTPGFHPRDLTPFGRELAGHLRLVLARTQPGHGAGSPAIAGARPDRRAGEVAPDGNAVSLDREAVRIAETDTAHQLAMAVHRSFAGMFRIALGR